MTNAQKVIKMCAIAFAIFLIVMILNSILFAFSLLGGFSLNNKKMNIEEKYSNIHEINLDLSASNIRITNGSELKIEAENVSSSFSSKARDGKLTIKEKLGWTLFNHSIGTIHLTIPENEKIEKMVLSSGAGKIEIENIHLEDFKIEQGAGLLSIKNSSFQNTKIEGGAGEIKIQNSILEDLKLDSGVGKVSIEGEILGSSKIASGIGETILNLGNKNDYTISAQKGIGSIEIEEEKISNETTIGVGENKIKIEGGIGAIKINFRG